MKLRALTFVSGLMALGLLLLGAPARAEFRHIDLKTFGMD